MNYFDLLNDTNRELGCNIDINLFNKWCEEIHLSSKSNPTAYLNYIFAKERHRFTKKITTDRLLCDPIPLFNAMRKKGFKISQKDTDTIDKQLNKMLESLEPDEVADIVESLVDECKTTKSFIEKLCYNNCNEGDVK